MEMAHACIVCRWRGRQQRDGHRGRPAPGALPQDTGGGHSRYRLHQVGKQADGTVAYAVYGAPDMADDEVSRVADERAYARRFEAEPEVFVH